ncbi:thioesterase family protein [Coraliomargarita sp. SDUM461004]|uniref:Thioesterase family protein n=1 Tax=Thalassobacterium sedimentorum TaxID=3041258 RepID=A0ABU1AHC7_9BACT|nr:thioesterase family protein [Coraliomargarita sp. SDUM461004]MDQ8193593.1 thioesterase family protein [Coraliomargarita sp. SDUM461004]
MVAIRVWYGITTAMPYEHTSTRRIEFSETDMAGLVHFSNFFKYMETAERDFFEAAGLDLIRTQPGEMVGWPRARAECKFSAPIRFGDTIDIHLAVKAVKDRAIEYQFRIFRRNPDGSRTQAGKGQMTTILAQLCEDGSLKSIRLPADLRTRITEAPAEILTRPTGV